MNVILKNTSGRLQTFVLPHESYCRASGSCACRILEGRPPRRIASSLTLATGTTSAELPEAVLTLVDVRRAVARGLVSVERVVPPAPAAPSKPPEPPIQRTSISQPKKKRGSR